VIEVRLAELLKARGKSRYWLVKRTGLSPITISNLYKGKTQGIDFETLNVICRELGCQPSDIFIYVNEEETNK
jgi:putative transcriptional regulator